jgi:DNA-binding response OmpR family regulator
MSTPDPYVFGRFELRLSERQLQVDGQAVALGSRAFDLLAALVERRERVVTKGELLDVVWPGLVVEENNLQVQVSLLRKLLGPQVIATIPGRGYRFTAQAGPAPVAVAAAAAAVPSQAADEPRRARLLVADDNKVNRLLLTRTLELQGHHVTSVDNGRRALEALRREPFDLLLLDLEMPELDGLGLLEHLARDPELRDLPAIVTSSLEGVEKVARCIELGAEDYLHKPVNPVLLKARVGSSLEKKRLRDEQKALLRRMAIGAAAPQAQPPAAATGQRVAGTVLHARLRDFTALAETEPAAEAIDALDSWHTLMFDAIQSHDGVVSQMMGDGLLASFGTALPLRQADDAPLAAVRAALEMAEMVELFNAERAALGKAPIAFAIGLASGEITAGYAGTQQRAAFTCIGATVDLAARLQSHAAQGGHAIVLDAATQAAIAGRVATQPAGGLAQPGSKRSLPAYAVQVGGMKVRPARDNRPHGHRRHAPYGDPASV